MDPKSISSSCNNDDGVPEARGMEKVLSDLNALKKLYGLLQRLDETSRALLKKLLDDAILKQANALTTPSDSASVIPFSLGSSSPKTMDQAASSSSSFLNNKEGEMEQILSDLQALTRLYMLLHKGPTDENLDEESKALLMKILEDATQESVRRQAKMLSSSQVSPMLERELSKRSDCRTRHADPRLKPMVSPRPSLLAGHQSRQLNRQHSTVSTSRSGLHVDGHRHAAEEPPLARLASKCSSRTELPARHRPCQEQRHSSVSLRRAPVPGTPQHGTVTGGTRLANHRWDSIRRSSGRGDQWTMEQSSSSWRSVSRELSLEPSSSLHGCATPRHVGTESSSSTRLFERLDSGLSVSMTSRHGTEHVGRGVATPERSSSSNTMATIQSRIRPSNSLHVERSPHRSAKEGRTSRERHATSDVSSADTYSSNVSSGSRSSWGAASLSASTSTSPPMSPPPPPAFATPYYSPPVKPPRGFVPPVTAPRGFVPPVTAPRGFVPPVTAPRGVVPPVYAPKVSRSMRRRHRQEILEKRVARLRMLKDKIATMFHHHRHHVGGAHEAGPSSKAIVHGAGHLHLPWQYLTDMFHHAKAKVKNTRSRTVAGVPEKRRGGGGGNMHALFDAVRRHLKSKRRAPAGLKLRTNASRALAKKVYWWQRLSRRRGVAGVTAGSRPRRRLGHGKAGWL